ncbi:protein involved in plasmid replication-relaxation [Murinocardiopsis flavida]|uniref:Protein involved in plasmid replication-relaxation n=1 Tax=Murinocardiopsis flavida TaxID=645275 RepID=A0A2P8DE73_9ACTN|nr:replication-relaxation family protein [Murinocardiopsis flavida]PSK95530.1 protein involved in plasmid replication-relaxation [Murinocardiopsis flavida]
MQRLFPAHWYVSHRERFLYQPRNRRLRRTRILNRLRGQGLVERIHRPGGGSSAWFTTDTGAQLVEGRGGVTARRYRMTPVRAAGPLRDHTLATVEAGLAFLEHARRRGDRLHPLGWTPEVAHRHRDGSRGAFSSRHVISDAVMSYVLRTEAAEYPLWCFLEVDRATMPVHRVAAKIRAYERYRDYVPQLRGRAPRTIGELEAHAWKQRYGPVFPALLIVLDGAGERLLRTRMRDLAAAVRRTEPSYSQRWKLRIGVTLLPWLKDAGPAAGVFLPLHSNDDALVDLRLASDGISASEVRTLERPR